MNVIGHMTLIVAHEYVVPFRIAMPFYCCVAVVALAAVVFAVFLDRRNRK